MQPLNTLDVRKPMKEYLDQALFKVTASLPYPIRLTGGPYKIGGSLGHAELRFETVRQTTYDPRLPIEGGQFDFEVDRHGWASFSRVSGDIITRRSVNPLTVLTDCLNQLIRHLRDTASYYWLHDLEEVDLFRVRVQSGTGFEETESLGRTGGITLRVNGLTPEAERGLMSRLASHEQVLQWRLLQLEADNALALGRYEEAVLLGWGALETALRTEAPRLARAARISAADLQHRVRGKDHPKTPPFSADEVAERAPILSMVRVICELAGTGYDHDSLAQSLRTAYQMRNVVTHRGIRLSGSQARRAVDAIRFVLGILRLPTSRPPEPFDSRSWEEHFGKPSVDFPKLLDTDEGGVVVIRTAHEDLPDPLTGWFRLERANSSFIVRTEEGVEEHVAAVLVVVTNDSYRYGTDRFPHLRVNGPPFLITGLLDELARTTTDAVQWAHAGLVRSQAGLSVQTACDYAADSIWKRLTRLNHTIDPGDARFIPLCTRIASYLVLASAQAFQRFRRGMASSHRQISDEASEVKNTLAKMDPADPHSICDALRDIHRRGNWLDSIVVRCPIESAEYGSAKRALQ